MRKMEKKRIMRRPLAGGNKICRSAGFKRVLVAAVITAGLVLMAVMMTAIGNRDDESMHQFLRRISYMADIDYEDDLAKSTGYLTIGWTVKKYDLPIDDAGNITFRCELERKYYVDESGVVHTTFTVDEEELLDKISAAYPDWGKTLRQDGGSVYLDAVMTCTVYKDGKHVPLGSMDSLGNLSGEVYLTYGGIAGARWWGDRNVFLPYYDLEIKYQPSDIEEIPTYEELREDREYTNYFGCDDEGVMEARIRFESDEYNVGDAIPSGENVRWESCCIYNAHKLTYIKTQIKAFYPVKVNVTQVLQWTDRRGGSHSERVSYSQWYTVERKAQYCTLKDCTVYMPVKFFVKDSIIPDMEYTYDYKYNIGWRYKELEYPEYTSQIDVDAGTVISSDNQRPALVRQDYSGLAQQAVGEFKCQSDELMINNVTVMDKDGYRYNLFMDILPAYGQTSIRKGTANALYTPEGTVEYLEYRGSTKERERGLYKQSINGRLPGNRINVWTPVVITGNIVDNKGENQMISPDRSRYELVCGCNFRVGSNLAGEHLKDYKGYGYKDYSCYADKVEVKFSFNVIQKDKLVLANTWVDIGVYGENGMFYLPCDVPEGQGEVALRVLAYNWRAGTTAEDISKSCGLGCNSLQSQHGAYVRLPVEISGQIKKFAIAGIEPADSGDKDLAEGAGMVGADKLPLVSSLKKGKTVYFTFETAGAARNVDNVLITPAFYGFSNNVKKELDIYVTKDGKFTRLTAFEDFGGLTLKEYAAGRGSFAGSFCLPEAAVAVEKGFDLWEYVNSKVVFYDDPCFYNGEIVVNFDITTVKSSKTPDLQPLSYENPLNAPYGYCNRWLKEGFHKRAQWDYGDIAVYDMKKDYRSGYVVRGTH